MDGATTLVGIIGQPVVHSRSPQMHNAAFRALGLNWAYVPFPVEPAELGDAVAGLKALGVRGFNVTIPHKQAVMPLLDDISPAAVAIGAVNTVVIDGGRLVGHNTDGEGFLRSLTEAHRFRLERSRALILGAGGASRAVCDALARAGVPALRISNRSAGKAEELAATIRAHHPGCDAKALDWNPLDHRAAINWAELIVNTTSVGLHVGDGSPLDTNGISPGHIVADLIYNPPQTPLLQKCAALRARTLNGLGMLLHQGAAAFALWTGKDAPVDVMRRALDGEPRPS
ncbi:MAG: shikimate dehydrogenase [Nitrospirae bacterium]|nr:shikimate dehydrogenase [Nitrospirota bacterium]